MPRRLWHWVLVVVACGAFAAACRFSGWREVAVLLGVNYGMSVLFLRLLRMLHVRLARMDLRPGLPAAIISFTLYSLVLSLYFVLWLVCALSAAAICLWLSSDIR